MAVQQFPANQRAALIGDLEKVLAAKSNTNQWRHKLGGLLVELKRKKAAGQSGMRSLAQKLGQDHNLFFRAIRFHDFHDSFSAGDIAKFEGLGRREIDEICLLREKKDRIPWARKALKEGWSLRRIIDEKSRKFGVAPAFGGRKRAPQKSLGLEVDIRKLTGSTRSWIAYTTDVWSGKGKTKLNKSNDKLNDQVKKLVKLLDQVQELAATVKRIVRT